MKSSKAINTAILASGSGSNFEAIVKAHNAGKLKQIRIKLLITDVRGACVRTRAAKLEVKDVFVDRRKFKARSDYDKELVKILRKEKVNLVVLAGFMRVLSPYFVRKFKNRILNIHPALLPAFRGIQAIERSYRCGVKITGVTVHFVDERVDHGPIVLQESLKVKAGESLARLKARIHRLEHKLYPEAIRLFAAGRLTIKARTVIITK